MKRQTMKNCLLDFGVTVAVDDRVDLLLLAAVRALLKRIRAVVRNVVLRKDRIHTDPLLFRDGAAMPTTFPP